ALAYADRSCFLDSMPRLRMGVAAVERAAMIFLIWSFFLIAGCLATSASDYSPTNSHATVLLVIGAVGESEYATNFSNQAKLWQSACAQSGSQEITIGLGD